jgi:hypothetical protein
VIVDEAHYIKNRSGRSVQVLRLVGAEGERDPQAVYLLTGTPMTDRPRDLFNLLKASRHPLSRSFYSFARRYCAAEHNGYGLDTRGASNVEELARIVAGVMLRRAKTEASVSGHQLQCWGTIVVVQAEAASAVSVSTRSTSSAGGGRDARCCARSRVARSRCPASASGESRLAETNRGRRGI